MALADSKKVRTSINRTGWQIEKARIGIAEIKDYRDRLIADGASVVGSPLEGNVAAFNTWISDYDALLNNVIANAIVAEIVPSHRGEAL